MSSILGMGAAQFAQQLVSFDRASKDQLYSTQQKTAQAKLDAYDLLERQMEKIESKLESFEDETFDSKAAELSGDEDAAGVSVRDEAPTGEFELEIDQLAKAGQLTTQTKEGETSIAEQNLPTSGVLSIEVGEETLELDLAKVNADGTKSLADLRSLINSSPDNPGVHVSLMRNGDNVELMITSDITGAGNDIAISIQPPTGVSVDDWSGVAADQAAVFNTALSGSNVNQQIAQDAKFSINGTQLTSDSNNVTDVIEGVDLELNKVHADGESTMIRIGQDEDAIVDTVESFVDSLNDLFEQVGALTQSMGSSALDEEYDYSDDSDSEDEDKDEDKDERPTSIDEDQIGILKGDSTLRGLDSSIKQILLGEMPGGFQLSDIGIEIGRDGKLDLDKDKLKEVINQDSSIITNIFNGEGGLVEKVTNKIEPLTKFEGFFDTKTKTLDGQINRIEDKMESHDRRMEVRYQTYLSQYTAMEAAIMEMDAISGII